MSGGLKLVPLPLAVVAGFMIFKSSPVSVNGRVCSTPVLFGYELPSKRTVNDLLASLTV